MIIFIMHLFIVYTIDIIAQKGRKGEKLGKSKNDSTMFPFLGYFMNLTSQNRYEKCSYARLQEKSS